MVGKIYNLPTSCPCGSKFDIQLSMSCKKGGIIYIRHNDLRDLAANMMSEVCKDTENEPKQHHYLEENCKVERLLWLAKIKSALFKSVVNSLQKNSGI